MGWAAWPGQSQSGGDAVMTAIQGNPEVWLIFQDLLDSARSLTNCQDPRRTFGRSYKSNGYEWAIGFVPADVPLSTAATSGLQWTQQGGIGFKGAIPHPLAQFILWARPSRYASQQSAHSSHQEGCRGPASSRRQRRDRICCLRTVGCFRR